MAAAAASPPPAAAAAAPAGGASLEEAEEGGDPLPAGGAPLSRRRRRLPPASKGAAPAKPLTDLDFRSGARIEELNQLVQEYHARRRPGAPPGAPPDSGPREREAAHRRGKERLFALLGQVQKSDGKLPQVNRYLLLSGGAQQGTLHVDWGTLWPLSLGGDYDTDFTLLVPVLDAAGVSVTLDLKQSPPGHARISLHPFGPQALSCWSDCCSGDEAFLSAERVADWFYHALTACAKDIRVERCGCVTSVLLSVGPYRILYDIVPVVALKGWPEVAQLWLTQTHFWDGKLKDEEVTGGFYLVPSGPGVDWRLAFSASEFHLRRTLPQPLVHALQAAMAVLGCDALQGSVAYHLFTLTLWSSERLPASYLSQEENAAHTMLGLLDDLLASLVHRKLPSYFLPQWNILDGLSRQVMENLAQEVARVRADPSGHLRQAVEMVKEAQWLAKAYRIQLSSSPAS